MSCTTFHPSASPNSTRPKWTHTCLKIVMGQLSFSSKASFCQSFHSSTMVVFCWEHSQSKFRYGHWPADPHHSHFYLWSRHYFKLCFPNAIVPKYRFHLSLTDPLHWPSYRCCLEPKVGTQSILQCHLLISESHPVLLLGQNAGWLVLPLLEKLNSYLSQVSGVCSTS